jgi:thioredoxin-like negative regulator of GroEL
MLRDALAIQRRVLGDEHPDTLDSMTELAKLLAREGRYDEAEKLLVAALAGRRRVLGENHPDTTATSQELARLGSLRAGK